MNETFIETRFLVLKNQRFLTDYKKGVTLWKVR